MDFLGDISKDEYKAKIDLIPNPQCEPQLFQKLWSELTVASEFALHVEHDNISLHIESLMRNEGFEVMASGEVEGQFKFYFFAQTVLFCVFLSFN